MEPSSIEDLEAEILKSGNKTEYYNFRSFKLVYLNGTVSDWLEFKSKPLFAAFSEKLETLPVSTILNLCRRHPDEFPYFLDFFDKSDRMANEPKVYLPYLCQRVDTIPIQWIVHHLQLIRDVRYAHQMLGLAFAKAITIEPHQLKKRAYLNAVWEKFKKITGSKNDLSYNDAWMAMTDIRVSMKELLEFKLSVRLIDYNRLLKEELVTRLLQNCQNPSKYSKLLDSQLTNYCRSRDLDLSSLVIATSMNRDWPVDQKLGIVAAFVHPCDMKRALEVMKFKDDTELSLIQEFAESKGIDFNVDPSNYINAVQESHQISTLSELANGEPNHARGYAEKLRRYCTLSEVKPIFELATNYGIVVKYDDFQDPEERREIMKNLILTNSSDEFENIWEVLQLSGHELIDAILQSFDDLKESSDILTVHMAVHPKRSNADAFLELLDKTIEFQIERMPTLQICDLWKASLLEFLDYVDGRQVMKMAETVRVITAIETSVLDEDARKELIIEFRANQDITKIAKSLAEKGLMEQAEELLPTKASDIDDAVFVEMLRGSAKDVVDALREIPVMEKQTLIKLLIGSIKAIDGTCYSRLGCIFSLLEERNLKYEKELAALQILHSTDLGINFHELMERPREVLMEVVTKDNVWDVSALAAATSVNMDKIILHLMINLMTSSDFDDYVKFIPELKRKDSIEPLLSGLARKLRPSDLTRLYQAMGRIDLKHRQATINDLNSYGLCDFISDKILENPSTLICELYTKMSLHEILGRRLHDLAKTIADRYELSINKIREYLVNSWLTEAEHKNATGETSIFVEMTEDLISKDENTNIQKSLFVLRSWKQRTAVKWLLRFIYQSYQISHRARAKAFACLFAIADESTIAEVFTGDMEQLKTLHRDTYYFSRLEKFNVNLGVSSLDREIVLSTVSEFIPLEKDLDPGIFAILLQMCLDFKIGDRNILLQLVLILKENRKLFILTHFNSVFREFPKFIDDEAFQESYIEVLSAPLDELIAKNESTRVFKAYHLMVIRYMYDALVLEPVPMRYWIIGGKRIEWDELVVMLCSAGYTTLAAELGAFVVDKDMRNSILMTLLNESRFDEALKFGFDKDIIFQFIVKEDIVQATEVMVDESFVMFVAWLKEQNDEASIEIVRDTLTKQGRTMEVKRMNDRLAKN